MKKYRMTGAKYTVVSSALRQVMVAGGTTAPHSSHSAPLQGGAMPHAIAQATTRVARGDTLAATGTQGESSSQNTQQLFAEHVAAAVLAALAGGPLRDTVTTLAAEVYRELAATDAYHQITPGAYQRQGGF